MVHAFRSNELPQTSHAALVSALRRPAHSYHLKTTFISLKGWRRMEENRIRSITGWFRQHFGKPRNDLEQVKPSKCSQASSSSSVSDPPLPSVLSSSFRSSLRFDVFVCHNDEDSDLAQSLTSFLEAPSNGLRCYLQERDCPAGGAVSTELLQAVQDSHCWLLLLTPNFVKDDWCSYQMHQVLSEGPMSQRIIPAVVNMPRSQLPPELRFLFTVDLNTNKDFGYTLVYKAVLHYLKDMSEKEKSSSASHSDG
ncbi:toll/interleukin-1 receptor domain-containing adapter protein-like [Carassius auratus]|uniref:Toll/interleukin-1 receptor domain-containing adapter protein-like n=1 Tax=Carassius auratus TaxID=7957 RepID=A0A6P6LRP6_CARAU|nr:toll/interleukin-1 receptor domain-containing adapter protein-like [Carassius auratus]